MGAHPLILRLAAIRHQRRITQQEISILSGLTQSTISHWESGRSMPTVYALGLYARAMGLEITLTPKGEFNEPHI